jgi:trigger factor
MTDEPRPEDQTTEQSATATETPEGEKKDETKKLKQSVEMKDIGPCKKHVKVTVERAAIDERLKEKFSELGRKANVAGFRPGKAPHKLVERRYHNEVGDQVKTEVLLASLEQLADETDLAPLSQPNIDPTRMELPREGDFVYEFEVEVRPEFDLPDYKGLKLKRPIHTFSEEDVDREQRRLLQSYGQVVPKPEGNAQIGDVLVADITFKDGDRVLNDMKETSLRVEKQLALSDALASKFAEQVGGAKAGDTRTVDLELSSQAANPDMRGKNVQMILNIKDVKTIRIPELTPEFLSQFRVSNPEQLRELIKVALDRKLEHEQRQSARRQVANYIAAQATWELPQDLLLRQARKALQRKVMEMRSDGISEEEIQSQLRLLQQNIARTTEMALKEHFVLQKIAEVEKIEVNDEDLDEEIERMAEQSGESARRVRARMEKEDMIDALAAEMIERRTLDLILDSATYEDVPLGGEFQQGVATVEQQAVPGEMRDLEAEAAAAEAEAAKPADETPAS